MHYSAIQKLRAFGLQWAVIVLCCGCAKATPFGLEHHFELADEIPIGKTTVEVLQLRLSERTEELSQRMSLALAANKGWWLDYLKKHIDERPLPYHTNLGLTKIEYAELLDGYDKTRRLQKVSDAYVTFKRNGDLLSIDIGDTNSPIQQWELNLSTGKLATPIGEVDKPKWQTGDDPKQPIGVYEGYVWHYENGDNKMSDIQITTLSIFRLKTSGMIFWRLQDSMMHGNAIVRSTDLVFRYEMKQGEETDRH